MAMPQLTPDFSEFLKLLSSNGVQYLLIGGYAVNVHGLNRPTKNMDIWIAVSPRNIDGVLVTLEQFGFEPGTVSRKIFEKPDNIFRMGVPPNRLELFTSIPGVDFDACYKRRIMVEVDATLRIPVINYQDLKVNKLSTGRASDLGDIEKLEEGRKPA